MRRLLVLALLVGMMGLWRERLNVQAAAPLAQSAAITLEAQGWGQQGERLGVAFIVNNADTATTYTRVPWQITVYDADGFALKNTTGDFWAVWPAGRSAHFEEIVLNRGEVAARVDVRVRPGRATPLTHLPDFTLDPIGVRTEGERTRVSVTLLNNLDHDVTGVRVYAVAYDDAGAIIGGGWEIIRLVPALDQSGTQFSLITAQPPASVEVYWSVADLKPFLTEDAPLVATAPPATPTATPTPLVSLAYTLRVDEARDEAVTIPPSTLKVCAVPLGPILTPTPSVQRYGSMITVITNPLYRPPLAIGLNAHRNDYLFDVTFTTGGCQTVNLLKPVFGLGLTAVASSWSITITQQ